MNFCVYSRCAKWLELLLFDGAVDAEPARVIQLEAPTHRTYHYWHAFIPELCPGQVSAYRAVGLSDPARGLRFDPAKVLLDPYRLGRDLGDAVVDIAADGTSTRTPTKEHPR